MKGLVKATSAGVAQVRALGVVFRKAVRIRSGTGGSRTTDDTKREADRTERLLIRALEDFFSIGRLLEES